VKPPLVIFVHGILTHAKWQKTAAAVLSLPKYTIPNCAYDFGRYGIHKFLRKASNDKAVEQFYDYYNFIIQNRNYDLNSNNYLKRPSIIVHSLGSYLVGMCMQKYPEVKFDKIILCGSILPTDFDWSTLLDRDQINSVRNEFGSKDFWSGICGKFVRGTGSSGRQGFQWMKRLITQEGFELFEHSDYFKQSHIENYWIPFLQNPPSSLRVVHGTQVKTSNEFGKIFDSSGKIDDVCFQNLPDYSEVHIPHGLALAWVGVNPDIYTFLFDRADNSVKGYINAMPIKDDVFEKIKTEGIDDNKIKEEDVVPFGEKPSIKIYLMSIALSPEVRQTNQGLFQAHFELLFCGFIRKLRRYATHFNTKVTEFVSVGWTAEGKALCESLGMKQVSMYRSKYPVYWLNLEEPNILEDRNVSFEVHKLVEFYRSIKS
jgi:hypothetical protein